MLAHTRGTSPHPAAPPVREERVPGLRRPHPGAGTRRRVRGEQGGRYVRGGGGGRSPSQGSIFGAEVSGCEGVRGACSPRQLPEPDKARHTAELGTATQPRRGVTGSGGRGELNARLCLRHVLGCGRAGLNRAAQRLTRGSLHGVRCRAPGWSRSGSRAGAGAVCRLGASRFPPARALVWPRHGGSAGYCRRLDEL